MSEELAKKKLSGWASASLIFAIFAMIPFLGALFGPFALVFGIIAKIKIAKNKETLKGNGRAIFGIVIGFISVFLTYMFATDPRMRFRNDFIDENASTATSYLRSMSTAAETYKTANNGTYPSSTTDLTEANPPYLKEMFCDKKIKGIYYSCEFAEDGYCFDARFKKQYEEGEGFLRSITGGILEELSCDAGPRPKIVDNYHYMLYIPVDMDLQEKRPLVVALSPSGNARSMINVWKEIAQKNKWYIFASKRFRNGIPFDELGPKVMEKIKEVIPQYAIDQNKIIFTGFSGGGMGSHMFTYDYPDVVSAIVVNTGMMDEYYIERKDSYPKGKLAVFLASPTDFRYDEMQNDQKFLESLGWKTKWIEFEGGHRIASESAYNEAVDWLKENGY